MKKKTINSMKNGSFYSYCIKRKINQTLHDVSPCDEENSHQVFSVDVMGCAKMHFDDGAKLLHDSVYNHGRLSPVGNVAGCWKRDFAVEKCCEWRWRA